MATGTNLMSVAMVGGDLTQYARAGPICGARTGLAMPKKITTPCPPQRVDSASVAPG